MENLEAVTKAIDERDAAITKRLDALEQSGQETHQAITNLEQAAGQLEPGAAPSVHTKAHRYSYTKVLQSLANPRKQVDGLEAETSQELRKSMPTDAKGEVFVPFRKALDAGSESPTSGGANFLQTETYDPAIRPLTESSLFMDLGPRVITGSGFNALEVPRIATDATGYIVDGDGTNLTESGLAADSVSLPVWYFGALQKVNKKVLDQGVEDTGMLVMEALERSIVVKIDQEAFAGAGSAGPEGIATTSNQAVAANSPEDVSYATLISMQRLLINAKVPRNGWVYVASPDAWELMATTLKDASDTASSYILEPSADGMWRAAGLPVYSTTHLSGNGILLYRPASVLATMFGQAIGLEADPYGSNFASGSVSFRGFCPFNSKLQHEQACVTHNL